MSNATFKHPKCLRAAASSLVFLAVPSLRHLVNSAITFSLVQTIFGMINPPCSRGSPPRSAFDRHDGFADTISHPGYSLATERRSLASANSWCTADRAQCRNPAVAPLLEASSGVGFSYHPLGSKDFLHSQPLPVLQRASSAPIPWQTSCCVIARFHQPEDLMLTLWFDVHKLASGLQVDLVGVESFLRIRMKLL